jgi:hypothetical protein
MVPSSVIVPFEFLCNAPFGLSFFNRRLFPQAQGLDVSNDYRFGSGN